MAIIQKYIGPLTIAAILILSVFTSKAEATPFSQDDLVALSDDPFQVMFWGNNIGYQFTDDAGRLANRSRLFGSTEHVLFRQDESDRWNYLTGDFSALSFAATGIGQDYHSFRFNSREWEGFLSNDQVEFELFQNVRTHFFGHTDSFYRFKGSHDLIVNVTPEATVPEPGTILLMLAGLMCIFFGLHMGERRTRVETRGPVDRG